MRCYHKNIFILPLFLLLACSPRTSASSYFFELYSKSTEWFLGFFNQATHNITISIHSLEKPPSVEYSFTSDSSGLSTDVHPINFTQTGPLFFAQAQFRFVPDSTLKGNITVNSTTANLNINRLYLHSQLQSTYTMLKTAAFLAKITDYYKNEGLEEQRDAGTPPYFLRHNILITLDIKKDIHIIKPFFDQKEINSIIKQHENEAHLSIAPYNEGYIEGILPITFDVYISKDGFVIYPKIINPKLILQKNALQVIAKKAREKRSDTIPCDTVDTLPLSTPPIIKHFFSEGSPFT